MFDNLDDPRTQAILQMGLGLLGNQSGNFGKDLGGAGLLGINVYNQGLLRKAKIGEEKQQQEMRAAQMAQMKAQQEAQAQQAQAAARVMAQRPDLADLYQVNPQEAIKRAFPAQQGPQFKEVGGRLVKIDGDKVQEAYAPPPKPAFQPGQTREIKSGRVVITQEWDGSGWKQIAKSSMDKPEDGPGLGKPPQGYRWRADGALEPIPGGPADAKVGKEADALAKRQSGAVERANFVLSKVGDAIKQTGFTTTGAVGSIARNIPGTGGYDLNKTIDAIRANVGFGELQAMREASPTGGALGQVAVQELNMLQSVLGSLDTAQSQDQLLRSLYSIEKHYNNWKRAVQQDGQEDAGQSNIDALVKKYGGS